MATAQSPLLRIRAGIEAGNADEVIAGVKQADTTGVTLAANVRDMITQWLKVNAPDVNLAFLTGEKPPEPVDEEGITAGQGTRGWSASEAAGTLQEAAAARDESIPNELLRKALLRIFETATKGSDAALGLGIVEDGDDARFLPFTVLASVLPDWNGRDEEEMLVALRRSISQAQRGVFCLSADSKAVGLNEWAGWEEFSSGLSAIQAATRDPAFEPRSIQTNIVRCARGAVRAGTIRQPEALRCMQESLSPQDMPEDAQPALRSAISRRTRLALACLVDAIAAAGLAPEAPQDAMGLVGQLPRTLFGLVFDHIDDRDRGACAFLNEIIQSWSRRKCFSKRWLEDASSKFTAPKGANSERDEGKGWYALMADNLKKAQGQNSLLPPEDGQANGDAGGEGDDGKDAAHRANKKRGIVQDDAWLFLHPPHLACECYVCTAPCLHVCLPAL